MPKKTKSPKKSAKQVDYDTDELAPSDEQGMIKPETAEDAGLDMEIGEKEATVYSEEGREKLVEDDEIDPFEEGYMEGAEGRGKRNSCAECGKLISEDSENIVEREFEGEIKWFCSEKHAKKYAEKHSDKENPDLEED